MIIGYILVGIQVVLKAPVRHKDGKVVETVVLTALVDGEPVARIIIDYLSTVMNTRIGMTCLNLVDEVGGF